MLLIIRIIRLQRVYIFLQLSSMLSMYSIDFDFIIHPENVVVFRSCTLTLTLSYELILVPFIVYIYVNILYFILD